MCARFLPSALAAILAASSLPASAEPRAVAPVADFLAACAGRDGWGDAAPPVHLFANVYGVGTCGITSLLVTSGEGLVLIDGGPEEAAQPILANIRRLGFAPQDVKWILSSHEHGDHAGGVAELQRTTGAKIAALETAKAALESGTADPSDPQAGIAPPFPPIRVDRVLRDGDRVELGPIALTAHATPTHSPGSTSWTWRSCEEAVCLSIAYADSVSTISADGYRFSDHPGYVANVRRGLDVIGGLDCDVLITPHPSASRLHERLAEKALIDPAACAAYAENARQALAERLTGEAEGAQ